TGLNRGLGSVTAELVQHINKAGRPVIAIDLPSGLFADRSSKGETVIEAKHTLSFQCYKLALILAENHRYFGTVQILDIGLHPDFPKLFAHRFEWVDARLSASIYQPR